MLLRTARIMQSNAPMWAYLKRLRRSRRISQQAMADALGITRLAWGQIERGETERPGADLFFAGMKFLRGSWDHIRELADDHATIEDAVRLAAHRVSEEHTHGLIALGQSVSQREMLAAVEELERELVHSTLAFPRLALLLRRYLPPPDEAELSELSDEP